MNPPMELTSCVTLVTRDGAWNARIAVSSWDKVTVVCAVMEGEGVDDTEAFRFLRHGLSCGASRAGHPGVRTVQNTW